MRAFFFSQGRSGIRLQDMWVFLVPMFLDNQFAKLCLIFLFLPPFILFANDAAADGAPTAVNSTFECHILYALHPYISPPYIQGTKTPKLITCRSFAQ